MNMKSHVEMRADRKRGKKESPSSVVNSNAILTYYSLDPNALGI